MAELNLDVLFSNPADPNRAKLLQLTQMLAQGENPGPWVFYGHGNNGKTTLARKFQSMADRAGVVLVILHEGENIAGPMVFQPATNCLYLTNDWGDFRHDPARVITFSQ